VKGRSKKASFTGSCITESVRINGAAAFHFDEDLLRNSPVAPRICDHFVEGAVNRPFDTLIRLKRGHLDDSKPGEAEKIISGSLAGGRSLRAGREFSSRRGKRVKKPVRGIMGIAHWVGRNLAAASHFPNQVRLTIYEGPPESQRFCVGRGKLGLEFAPGVGGKEVSAFRAEGVRDLGDEHIALALFEGGIRAAGRVLRDDVAARFGSFHSQPLAFPSALQNGAEGGLFTGRDGQKVRGSIRGAEAGQESWIIELFEESVC